MKIIHCADLHLDSKMESNFSREMSKERRNEIFRSFTRMVSYARTNDVSVILIAGDLFDTKADKQITIKKRCADVIRDAANIEFLYLCGNHDEDNYFLQEGVLIPPNLKLFNKDWKSYDYGKVTISGIEFGNNNESTLYSRLNLDKNRINIVTMHGQEVANAGKDKTEVINLNSLKNKNIDYLALGHVHLYKDKVLDGRGIYCYCGCPDGRGFDECGKKGFVVLEIDDEIVNSKEVTLKKTGASALYGDIMPAHAKGSIILRSQEDENKAIKRSFVSFSEREFHEISVDITQANSEQDIKRSIEAAVSAIPDADIVKIILSGEKDLRIEYDTQALLAETCSRFYFSKIYDKAELKIDYDSYRNDISLKGEFIRLIEQSNLSGDEKSHIIEAGIRALNGRELI